MSALRHWGLDGCLILRVARSPPLCDVLNSTPLSAVADKKEHVVIDDDDDVHVSLHVHDYYYLMFISHVLHSSLYSFMERAHSFHFEDRSGSLQHSFMGLGLLPNSFGITQSYLFEGRK